MKRSMIRFGERNVLLMALRDIVRAITFAAFLVLLGGELAPLANAKAINPPSIPVHSTTRVVVPVDNSQRTVLHGQTLPVLANATDLGEISADAAMDHMLMLLQASPAQDHALKSLIDQQVDSGHPNFHNWLTPDQFGSAFGVADSDIAQVTDWLSDQGFTVEQVAPGKRFIQFSGTVGQVEAAFQTQMHTFSIGGQAHVANNSDISIPTALVPVVAGVPTLNNFFKTSDARNFRTVSFQGPLQGPMAAGTTSQFYPSSQVFSAPDYTNGTTHFVGAGDFATIYNTTPLLNAGFDGTGVSIGVIGRTDIHLSDVQIYRQFFNLKHNDPQFIVAGEDPGVVGGDDGESYLDVEVSGGAAPGASVKFIVSRATLTTDGVDLSAMYAVQNNLTDIISESYGQCEANFTAVQAAFYSSLWGQAAAQGQSVFVSSGDNGPAGCDNQNNSFQTAGYAVSMLASSPYNVAVGGTLFADTTGGPYWGTTATASPPFASALGYIPEIPWNEAKASGATGASGLWSGSGGISAWFPTPAWQRGFGVPAADPAYAGTGAISSPATPFVPGPHRYLPDVAMAAAAQHDGTLYCGEGICQLSSTNTIVNAGIVGGTSVAAPTMAGVQALIDHVNGGRQGLPNYIYYALADAQHTAGLNCTSSSLALDPNCAFRDVTTGNTLICSNSACTVANKIGWTAAPGYDLATGLGSPNVSKLASLWSTITFRSSSTTLNLSQTSGIVHGQSVTASGSVAPGSGTGTPTGQVVFVASSGALTDPFDTNTGGYANQVALATLDGSGNYSIAITNLPAGVYYLTARYGGDGTFASSISAPIQVAVSQESATVSIQPNAFNGTTCAETAQTTFTYGSYIWTDIIVAGASGQGIPTGTVSVTDNGSPLLTSTLNANGIGHFLSGAIPSTSCVFGYTFQDTSVLSVGTHQLGATYSGDANFGPLFATPVIVTISKGTLPTGTVSSPSTNIASGDTVQLQLTLAGLAGAGPGTLPPTGTVTFTDTTTSTTLGTGTLVATSTFGGIATITTNALTTAGAHSITASWPGDANYVAVTNPTAKTITVQAGTATSVVLTSNANPTTVGGRPTFTATMTPTTVTSGTVNFLDGGVQLGTGTVGTAHTATFRPAATVSLPLGTHNITAVYAGTATFNSSTSAPLAEVFNKGATTIQLTVLNSGLANQVFTVSAALGLAGTAAPPATGTITFFDGSSPIGSPVPFTIVTAANGGSGIFLAQTVVPFSVGTHTITAQLSDPNYTAPVSNTQTINVSSLAAVSFNPASIAVSGTSALTFVVGGPAVTSTQSVSLTDRLPSGLTTPDSGATPTCGGSLSVAGGLITLSGAQATSTTCTFSVPVTATASGIYTDVASISDGSTASAVLVAGASDLSATGSASPSTVGITGTTSLTVTVVPGAVPASTGITVTADLTSIGGSATQAFTNTTGNTFVASNISIPLGTSAGAKTLPVSVADGQGRSAGTSISLTVTASTGLSGTGSAVPDSAIVGGSSVFTVAVTGGANPPSSGITVSGDLSGIGGSATQAFTDNGNGTFSYSATVGNTATPGAKAIPVTISDAQNRTAPVSIAFTVLAPGALGGSGTASPSSVAPSGSTILTVTPVPGANPASTGLAVTADLSSIGGNATQAFASNGDGTYSYTANIPLATTPGTKNVPVTITDAQSRSGSTNIALTVLAPTSLSGSGAASPSSVAPSGSTILTVTPVPGANPASTGLAVTADLSSIGGSATQAFASNGDGTFSYTASVPLATTPGNYSLPVSISDAQSRSGSTNITLTVLTPGNLGGSGTASPSSVAPSGSTILTVTPAPGTNPASTGVAVTADLSSIGGSATQAFASNGDGTFSYTASVPLATTPGTKSVPVTITDAQSRTGSTNIALTVLTPTAISGSGTATPNANIVGGASTLTVTVTGGTNPTSSGVAVTADLSGIDGSSTQAFTDNGSGIFSFNAMVGPGATPGLKSIPVTITDAQGRSASTIIAFNVTVEGALSGTGLAVPGNVGLAGEATLLVSVVPGSNPVSTGLTVTVDLSSIGGSATQAFYDDATHGDQTSGDNIYTFVAPIPSNIATGTKLLPVTITDGQGRTGTSMIQLGVTQGSDVIFVDSFEGM